MADKRVTVTIEAVDNATSTIEKVGNALDDLGGSSAIGKIKGIQTAISGVEKGFKGLVKLTGLDYGKGLRQIKDVAGLALSGVTTVAGGFVDLVSACSGADLSFQGSEIEREEEKKRAELTYLRKTFPSLLITGPFSIILGFNGGIMALNDRLKLRSMVVGEKDDFVYIASEECAIRKMQPDIERVWAPKGGEPVIVRLDEVKK